MSNCEQLYPVPSHQDDHYHLKYFPPTIQDFHTLYFCPELVVEGGKPDREQKQEQQSCPGLTQFLEALGIEYRHPGHLACALDHTDHSSANALLDRGPSGVGLSPCGFPSSSASVMWEKEAAGECRHIAQGCSGLGWSGLMNTEAGRAFLTDTILF